jgi:hypothetical protein
MCSKARSRDRLRAGGPRGARVPESPGDPVKFTLAVVVPFLAQVLFVLAFIAATRGKGSFVGLAAMLTALLALPLTALANWLRTRRKPPLPAFEHAARTFLTTLVFPVLLLILYAVAS